MFTKISLLKAPYPLLLIQQVAESFKDLETQGKSAFLTYFICSVALSDRCNGRQDCPDKSDEVECETIKFDRSYLKDLPPIPMTKYKGKCFTRLHEMYFLVILKRHHDLCHDQWPRCQTWFSLAFGRL